jgi:hypothetical protein
MIREFHEMLEQDCTELQIKPTEEDRKVKMIKAEKPVIPALPVVSALRTTKSTTPECASVGERNVHKTDVEKNLRWK